MKDAKVSEFERTLRNLESAYRRLDSGQLTGRNRTASDYAREVHYRRLEALAHTDEVCDALDANERLARRWNNVQRRAVWPPLPLSRELQKVRRAAGKAARAVQERDEAIRAARDLGIPLRAIAKEAGLSPEWVRRIAAR